jgi:Fe-S oxidoreductase
MARDRRALSMALQTEVPACALKPGSMCCGYPLYADGQLDLVEENLIRIAGLLEGHELVVTPDPGCAYMLTTVMDALVGTRGRKKRPDVVPLVEVLAQNAHRFQDTSPGLVVRYHDPCYLARRGRTFDAPRKLLSSSTGHAPLEFAAARDEAACSGAGGLYPMSNPEGAKDVARRRALDDGNADQRVDVVATACPSARRNFERAGIRAVDVVDVVLGEVKLG